MDAAIERSQSYLLGIQKPEGYWMGELMVDSTLVSDMIAFHHKFYVPNNATLVVVGAMPRHRGREALGPRPP